VNQISPIDSCCSGYRTSHRPGGSEDRRGKL